MVAQNQRKLEDGVQFDALIPRPDNKTFVVSKNTDIPETVEWIMKIIRKTQYQTAKLAPRLRGRNLRETCGNIWRFVYKHIQYREDAKGIEQLHTPARIWAKRKYGVDCDDYTILIGTILLNLGIPFELRLAEYAHKGYYQHIYIIVMVGKNKYITIDPVKDCFDCEHPYTNYEDIDMELHTLSGFYDDLSLGSLGTLQDAEVQAYKDAIEKLPIAHRENLKKWLLSKDAKYSALFEEVKKSAWDYAKNAPDTEVLLLGELYNIYTIPETLELLATNKVKPQYIATAFDTPIKNDKPKFLSGAWFKKNKTPLIVTGIALTVVGLIAVSYMAESEAEAKEQAKKGKKQGKDDDDDDLQGVPKGGGYKTSQSKKVHNKLQ